MLMRKIPSDSKDSAGAATSMGITVPEEVSMGTPPVPKISAMAGRASTARPSEAGNAMMPLMRSELKI